jgi:nucleoside-diphosphate-sugar epimerase
VTPGPLEGPGGRCLVTGASGFIGGRVASRLRESGLTVRCLVRGHSDTAALERLGAELVIGDLTDRQSLEQAAADCDHVVHCAALVSDWATTEEIHTANVAGTQNLLTATAAATRLRRFVHISSTDVYGHPGTPNVEEEQRATGFANWYAQTKREAEDAVVAAHLLHGLPAVVLRPATVYGPGSVDVIGEIARAIRGRHMLLVERGRSIAGLCFVENVVDAVQLALTHPAAVGEIFNISDGLDISWRQFTADLAAGLGAPPPRLSLPFPVANAIALALEHGYRALRRVTRIRTEPLLSRQAVQVLGRDQSFSCAKARAHLGWEPRVGYEDGVDQTLAWLRDEYLPAA